MGRADSSIASAGVVEHVEARDFRSFEHLALALGPGVTELVGLNGVGKTNALEAVALALRGSSPRTTNDRQCIRDTSDFVRVAASLRDAFGDPHTVTVSVTAAGNRTIKVDGDQLRTRGELARRYPTAVFLPERLLIIRGAPPRRRALIDQLAAALSPAVARSARDYVAALGHRNTLLRRIRGGASISPRELQPWTDILIETGTAIRVARADALAAIAEPLRTWFAAITGFADGAATLLPRGADLTAALAEGFETDCRRGSTTAGPHLDDLQFLEGTRDLKLRGSNGEQRAMLLAWTMASGDTIARSSGTRPLLLLDEPFAELDLTRRARLAAALLRYPQVVVTGTEATPELHGGAEPSTARIVHVQREGLLSVVAA